MKDATIQITYRNFTVGINTNVLTNVLNPIIITAVDGYLEWAYFQGWRVTEGKELRWNEHCTNARGDSIVNVFCHGAKDYFIWEYNQVCHAHNLTKIQFNKYFCVRWNIIKAVNGSFLLILSLLASSLTLLRRNGDTFIDISERRLFDQYLAESFTCIRNRLQKVSPFYE